MPKSSYPDQTRWTKRDTHNNPDQTTYHRKYKKLRYFFLNKTELHKVIHINRATDIVTTFSYKDGDYRQYLWSYVKKNHQKAYGTRDVANMVQRNPWWIRTLMSKGELRYPYKAYSLNDSDRYTWYFNEDQVLEIQDYFANVHWGRKRNDGLITPGPTPNRAELKAMMNDGTQLFIKGQDGAFKPLWRELEDI